MANQIAAETQKNHLNQSTLSNQLNQEKLDKLKQEHFKDIINENNNSSIQPRTKQSEKKVPPSRPGVDKIYGNLGDVVNYEE